MGNLTMIRINLSHYWSKLATMQHARILLQRNLYSMYVEST